MWACFARNFFSVGAVARSTLRRRCSVMSPLKYVATYSFIFRATFRWIKFRSRCARAVDLCSFLGKVSFDLGQCGDSQISKRGLKVGRDHAAALTDAADLHGVHGWCDFPVLHAVTGKVVSRSAAPKGVASEVTASSFLLLWCFVCYFFWLWGFFCYLFVCFLIVSI